VIDFHSLYKNNSEFPQKLLSLTDCPKSLHIAGRIDPSDNLALAVVGSRKMSSYGKEVCRDIVSKIVTRHVTIVSGFMYGVDIAAHNTAFEFGGRTIGVLGFGADFVGNVPDIKLAEAIVKEDRGALITEFNLDQAPQQWTFPKRDRIISALANAVLVIEAAEKSGTFYTVEACVQQGKDVLAVPGSIYSDVSKGCHKLIEDGARIVKSAEDVIEALGILSTSSNPPAINNTSLSYDEECVLKLLDQVGILVDDIIVKSEMQSSTVLSSLTALEMKEFIREVGGGMYRRI